MEVNLPQQKDNKDESPKIKIQQHEHDAWKYGD